MVVCEISALDLMPGRYVADLWLQDYSAWKSLDMIADAISFEVVPADMLGTGRLPPAGEGAVFRRARFSLREAGEAPFDCRAKSLAEGLLDV